MIGQHLCVFGETNMTDHHLQQARQLVDDFRNSLGGEAREYISEAQFEELAAAVHHLLAREHEHITDLLEALVRTLRGGVDKPEIGL
jgi:DNA-binding SARP family transcriptional activator